MDAQQSFFQLVFVAVQRLFDNETQQCRVALAVPEQRTCQHALQLLPDGFSLIFAGRMPLSLRLVELRHAIRSSPGKLSDVVYPLLRPCRSSAISHNLSYFFIVGAGATVCAFSTVRQAMETPPVLRMLHKRSAVSLRIPERSQRATLVTTLFQENTGLYLRQRLLRITRPSVFDVLSLERFHPQPDAKGNTRSQRDDA